MSDGTQNPIGGPSGTVPTFPVAFFRNKTDNQPKAATLPWGALAKRLMAFSARAEKDGPLWSPADFSAPGGDGLRAKANVRAVCAAVFDYDHAPPPRAHLDALGVVYLLHTTHSHLTVCEGNEEGGPRWRLVVPFAQPITLVSPEDWYGWWLRLREYLAPGSAIDESCKDGGRIYYLPACFPGATHTAELVDGPDRVFLDPTAVPELSPEAAATVRAARAAPVGETIVHPNRHTTLTSIAGSLRRRGLEAEEIAAALAAVNTRRCDPPLPDEDVEHIAQSVSRYTPGAPAANGAGGSAAPNGTPPPAADPWEGFDVAEDVDVSEPPPHVTERTARGGPGPGAHDDAPEVVLPPLPVYPTRQAPALIRALIEAHPGLPPAFVGGAGLAAAAVAVGGNAKVQVVTGRTERANLWVATIGPPGAGKSPAQDLAFAPLREYDLEVRRDFERALRAWRAAKPEEREALGPRPVDGSLLRRDTTVEAVARRLAGSEGDLGLDIDELRTLVAGLGQYKQGRGGGAGGGGDSPDLAKFLELWHGGPWTYTRVGTGGGEHNAVDLFIPRPTVVLCGSVQTEYLHLLGSEGDGLRPRWLPHVSGFVPPPAVRSEVELAHQEREAERAREAWADRLRLLLLRRGTERVWTLTPRAQLRFYELEREWKARAGDPAVNISAAAALRKADRQLGRVLLVVLELLDPGGEQRGLQVTPEQLDVALPLLRFCLDFWPAQAPTGGMALTAQHRVLNEGVDKLATWLELHGGEAAPRTLLGAHVAGVRTAPDLYALIERYGQTFPGTVEKIAPTAKGGRPGMRIRAPKRRKHPETPPEDPTGVEANPDNGGSKPPDGGSKPPENGSKPTDDVEANPVSRFASTPEVSDPLPADVVYVTSRAQLEPLLPALREAPRLGLDVETMPSLEVVAEITARGGAFQASIDSLAELMASVAVKAPPKPKQGQKALPLAFGGWWWADRKAAKQAVTAMTSRLRAAQKAVAGGEALRKASATNPQEARLRSVQLAAVGAPVVVLDVALAGPEALALLAPLFGGADGPVLISHYAHFEWAVLQAAGLPLPPVGRVVDTMLGAQVLDAGEHLHTGGYFSLAAVAQRLLGVEVDKTEQTGPWERAGPLTPAQLTYAAQDARVLLALEEALVTAMIDADPTARLPEVAQLEYDALPAVAWMVEHGIGFSKTSWAAQLAKEEARLPELRRAAQEAFPRTAAGTPVDVGSNAQVLVALHALGVAVTATDKDTLEALPEPPPAVEALLAFRQTNTRVTRYGRAVLASVAPRTGRIHAGYRQLGTETGRMSCATPNLQQIPRDAAYRACFVAPPGRVLLKCDLGQIELNVAAVLAHDAALLAALADPAVDLHRRAAAGMFRIPEGEVTPDQRHLGKSLNFGALYGMGKPGLIQKAATIGVRLTLAEAGRFLDAFKHAWPGLARWGEAQRRGREASVASVAGRRRRLPGGEQGTKRINTPVQAGAADCFKAGLALLWQTRGRAPSAVLVAAVHDELVAEADTAEQVEAQAWLEGALIAGTKRYLPDAPIRVKTTVGQTWAGGD